MRHLASTLDSTRLRAILIVKWSSVLVPKYRIGCISDGASFTPAQILCSSVDRLWGLAAAFDMLLGQLCDLCTE